MVIEKVKSYFKDFSHLLYPHNCEGCGSDVLNDDAILCTKCLFELPETNFCDTKNNPVEKTFYGRLNITNATASYYFTKDSLLQHLMIELKYRNNKNVGFYLGKQLGYQLLQAERFNDVDALIPLPLNPKKEMKRGYNQATIICEGIASVFQKPILKTAVIRIQFTETQTQQDRVHRWQNMQHVFAVADKNLIEGKHVLLIDDVVTTGATLEACGNAILQVPETKLSIATVAWTI
ncbi:DNA utilization protein GntX [mine drainage metagenome]|uniref:DNA utilization protein GntX n=1 Tax=mine drainage metagenome TaxID=410659 RepID=A0A1J5TJA6_9ZZZZ